MLKKPAHVAGRCAAALACTLGLLLGFPGAARANDNPLAALNPGSENSVADGVSLPAEVIVRALTLMGITYRWGGNLPETGMDCSGFVRHVFHEAAGLMLPRKSEEMSRAAVSIGKEHLLPGDLVFFNTQRRGFSHVGIYLGDEKFVHAPAKGKSIRIDSMVDRYWVRRFDGARRVMGELPNQDPAALDQLIDRTLARIGVPLKDIDAASNGSAALPSSSATGAGLFAGAQWRRQAAAAQTFIDEQAALQNLSNTGAVQRVDAGMESSRVAAAIDRLRSPGVIAVAQTQGTRVKAKTRAKTAAKPSPAKTKAASRSKSARA